MGKNNTYFIFLSYSTVDVEISHKLISLFKS